MGLNLATATHLGNEEPCARGFGKRWIGPRRTILSGKKSGALSSFVKSLAIAKERIGLCTRARTL